MSRVEVRPATRDDVPLIVQFIKDLAEYEREPQAAEATPAMIDEALFSARPACECLIGEVDGRPEGFALFFHNFSTWKGRRGVYLEDLFVRPSTRGVGLGKALLARLAQIALDRGCSRLEWNVLDWNEPALKFYRALGAEPLDGWTIHRLSGGALERLATQA